MEADLWIAEYFKKDARKNWKIYERDAKVLYDTLAEIGDHLNKEFNVYSKAVDNMPKLKGNPYTYNPPCREE